MFNRRGRPSNRERESFDWGKSALQRIKHEYTRKAKQKNLEWAISDWLLEKLVLAKCSYCQAPPANFKRRWNWPKDRGLKYNGLDRKDNSKGYTPDNIVTCCLKCNKLKSNVYTVEETRAMVRALLRYNARTGKAKPQ